MTRRLTLTVLLGGLAVAFPLLTSTGASATCLPGAPPGVPCLPVGSPAPAPSPSLETSPSPSPSASSGTSGSEDVEPTGTEESPAAEGVAPAPALDSGVAPAPATGDSGTVPLPETAPLDGGALPGEAPAGPAPETAGDEQAPVTETRINPVAAITSGSVAQSVSGAFAIVVGVLLALPLLLAALANQAARTMYVGGPAVPVLRTRPAGPTRAPARASRTDASAQRLSSAGLPADVASAVAAAIAEAITSSLAAVAPATTRTTTRTTSTTSRSYDRPAGAPVNPNAVNRLYLGLGALAVAALAGFVGWYQLSGNPNVNQQLPYLASAGVIVVIASAIGGALLVGEQLRGDDRRIEELEDAVRELAAALAPMIESPARRPARELAYDDVVEADVLDDEAPVTRRVRTTRTVARQQD